MVILLLGTIVLYVVPLRYLLLAWGINKFTKRIRKPNVVPNNELFDFLSRVPSDPEAVSIFQFTLISPSIKEFLCTPGYLFRFILPFSSCYKFFSSLSL